MTKHTNEHPYYKNVDRLGLISMVLFGLVSLFYESFFPLVFIIAGLVMFIRFIQDIRNKNYHTAIGNLFITAIFIVGMIITIRKHW